MYPLWNEVLLCFLQQDTRRDEMSEIHFMTSSHSQHSSKLFDFSTIKVNKNLKKVEKTEPRTKNFGQKNEREMMKNEEIRNVFRFISKDVLVPLLGLEVLFQIAGEVAGLALQRVLAGRGVSQNDYSSQCLYFHHHMTSISLYDTNEK